VQIGGSVRLGLARSGYVAWRAWCYFPGCRAACASAAHAGISSLAFGWVSPGQALIGDTCQIEEWCTVTNVVRSAAMSPAPWARPPGDEMTAARTS